MAGAAGGGGDREASDLCFFIFSVMIGWPEQLVAADDGKMWPLFFLFFL
jgi:hypothetical protein